jgi:CheY-like chemotaxis protein
MKLLVVDDDPALCKLIKGLVEPLGLEVRTSSDSQEAASIVETERFDGIMLDAVMPILDGYALARKIRATPPNQLAPIIMITGKDDVETMRQAFNAGATFFIGKPFTREKIYALFRTARGAMLAERRRYARIPYHTAVTCVRRGERFNAASISVGEGGMDLEGLSAASVDDVLELEFSLPDLRKPVNVNGKVRVKEASGRTSVEFVELSDAERQAIREFIHDKVKE